jgi:hypothetical protein
MGALFPSPAPKSFVSPPTCSGNDCVLDACAGFDMSVLVCVPSTDFRNCLAYRLGFFFNVDTDRSEAAGASRSCIFFIFTQVAGGVVCWDVSDRCGKTSQRGGMR